MQTLVPPVTLTPEIARGVLLATCLVYSAASYFTLQLFSKLYESVKKKDGQWWPMITFFWLALVYGATVPMMYGSLYWSLNDCPPMFSLFTDTVVLTIALLIAPLVLLQLGKKFTKKSDKKVPATTS